MGPTSTVTPQDLADALTAQSVIAVGGPIDHITDGLLDELALIEPGELAARVRIS